MPDFKKDRLGSFGTCVRKDGEIVVLKWYDSNFVTLATTFLSNNSKDFKKWNNKYSTLIDVCRLKAVQFYN